MDRGVAVNGSEVIALADQSGTAEPAKDLVSNGAPTNGPTYTAESSNFNNQPTITGNSTNILSSGANWSTKPCQTPCSVVVVCKAPVLDAIMSEQNYGGTGVAHNLFWADVSNGGKAEQYNGGTGLRATSATLINTPKLILWTDDGSADAAACKVYVNDFVIPETTLATNFYNPGEGASLDLLLESHGVSRAGVNTEVAEVIFFDGVLSDVDRANLATYLRDRYAMGADLYTSFNPATLPLAGWYRASYTGTPWTPTASAGTSGTNDDMTEATFPPTVGVAVNSFTPADFDGHRLQGAGFNSYCSGPAGTVVALFYADTATAEAGFAYNDPAIVSDTINGFNLGFSDGGVGLAFYDGGWKYPTKVPCSTNTWNMAVARWNGSTVEISVNGGAWSSIAASDMLISAHALAFGFVQIASVAYLDGKILEVMTAQATLSDVDIANIKSYFETRYGITLGAFAPESLPLTGWWRASYTGSPWTPTSSAGTSNANGNLSGAATAGAALNGFAPAAFDGTQSLASTALWNADLIGDKDTGEWYVGVLFRVNTLPAPSAPGDPWAESHLVGDAGGNGIFNLASDGIGAYAWNDGAATYTRTAKTAIATAQWYWVEAYRTGNTVTCVLNGVVVGTLTTTTSWFDPYTLQVGSGCVPSTFLDGEIAEVITAMSDFDAPTRANILDYVRDRYNLPLAFDPTANALHLSEPGNYNAGAQTWTATVGNNFEGPGYSGASPAAVSGCPDFNSDSDLVLPVSDTVQDFLPYHGVPGSASGFVTFTGGVGGGRSDTTPWTETHLLADHGFGGWGFTYFLDTGVSYVRFWHYTQTATTIGGTDADLIVAVTAGTRCTLHWRQTWDGANGYVQFGVDGVWGAQVAVTSGLHSSTAAGRLKIGGNYTASGALVDATIHAVGFYNAVKNDAFFNGIVAEYA
jgi:hypothetical protein